MRAMPYGAQLERKRAKMAGLFADLWQGEWYMTPSPETLRYRNKLELSFSHQVASKTGNPEQPFIFENRVGQKAKGRWDKAFDMKDCLLFDEKIGPLAESVRLWAQKNNYSYYDLRRHEGMLRHLLLRRGINTGEMLVTLFVREMPRDTAGFVAAVTAVYPDATVCIGVNAALSDVASAPEIIALKGSGRITEKLTIGGYGEPVTMTVSISPRSFLQTNTKATELLYGRIRSLAAALSPSVIFDLYGGAGTISMACAGLAKKYVCVESVPDAVADGKANAARNGNAAIEFVCSKMEDYIGGMEFPPDGLVILDPPRCGLHPKVTKRLLEQKPRHILYISCGPANLARDLKALVQSYRIDGIEGFDLFPHTEHFEVVARLSALDAA